MHKIFQYDSMVTFLDTLCTHFMRNASAGTTLTYEIDHGLIPFSLADLDSESQQFLQLFSLLVESMKEGSFALRFILDSVNNDVVTMSIECDFRSVTVLSIESLGEKLRTLQGISVESINDISAHLRAHIALAPPSKKVEDVCLGLRGKRVLFIGESPMLVRYTKLLTGLGVICQHVQTAGEAFEVLFEDSSYELLFMDKSDAGIDPTRFKQLLMNNPLFQKQYLWALSEAHSMGYAQLLEDMFHYAQGVHITQKVSTGTSTDTPIFDEQALLDRTSGNSTFVKRIITLYCKDMEKHLETLDKGMQEPDKSGMQRIAHSMKGASFSCCASRMAIHSKELESVLKAGAYDGVPVLLETLKDSLGDFKSFVTDAGYL